MPYYHSGCGGEIKWRPPFPIPPRCKKCGKRWSALAVYGPPRRDMLFEAGSWKIPKFGIPRWARILIVVGLLVVGVFVIVLLGGFLS